MTTSTTIAELKLQREERHRLLDQEYDQRIATIQKNCKHAPYIPESRFDQAFEEERKLRTGVEFICRHCGADMPTQST